MPVLEVQGAGIRWQANAHCLWDSQGILLHRLTITGPSLSLSLCDVRLSQLLTYLPSALTYFANSAQRRVKDS